MILRAVVTHTHAFPEQRATIVCVHFLFHLWKKRQLIWLQLILQPVWLSDPAGRGFSDAATNRWQELDM